MLTHPPATNQSILTVAAAAVSAIAAAQLAQSTTVQQILGALFLVSGLFLAIAAFRPLAILLFAGSASLAVASVARALLGQFIPGLAWQQRVILFFSWGLLALAAAQRAHDAWRLAHRGAP